MKGYDYDYFNAGLEDVEAMFENETFEPDFPEYFEPEIPDISMPEPVISSSAPKKDTKKDAKKPAKASDKAKEKVDKKAEKKVKDAEKTPKTPKKEPKKKADKPVKEVNELDELVLDKVSDKKTEKKEQIKKEEPKNKINEEEVKPIELDDGVSSIAYDFDETGEIPFEVDGEDFEAENEPLEEPQIAFSVENEPEVNESVNEPELSPEEPQNSYVYVEPFEEIDEVEVDEEKEEKKGIIYSPVLIKVLAFVAMLVVIIGLPIFLSSLGNKSRGKDEISEVRAASTDEVYYQNTKSYKTYEMTDNSTRFKTLDDLTFYLESNINATLSNEQALYNTYISGGCTDSYYSYTLSGYIDFTDEMSHLLTANKELYKEEGLESDYEELSEALDTLMVYGDSIR